MHNLQHYGCVVQIKGDNARSCSAVIIDARAGLVLTHSTFLLPKLAQHNKALYEKTCDKLRQSDVVTSKHGSLIADINDNLDVCVTVNSNVKTRKHLTERAVSSLYNIIWDRCTNKHKNVDGSLQSSRHSLVQYTGQVMLMWRVASFADALDTLMPRYDGWEIKHSTENHEQTENNELDMFEHLATFVLLRCEGGFGYDMKLKKFLDPLPSTLGYGEQVCIRSTPFAALHADVFFDSLSEGVVSNISGVDGSLVLTDARCLPGSEGGAVIRTKGGVCGIVVAPVCIKANEWTGLTITCSLTAVTHSLCQLLLQTTETLPAVMEAFSLQPTTLSPTFPSPHHSSVHTGACVLIECDGGWGSGVVINPSLGLVLTCSHVVKFTDKFTVQIYYQNQKSVASVIYHTVPNSVYDLALLQVSDTNILSDCATITVAKPSVGEPVYCIGHALFPASSRSAPLITKGTISKVLRHQGFSVMIQTTCAVNGGVSGGGLYKQDGRLVGIIVCNLKDHDIGAYYPHVNMIVPVCTVWRVIAQYMSTKDISVLQKLHLRDERVERLWQLQSVTAGLDSKL